MHMTAMEKKEENYVQEILTLERHIDTVTRQLEEANKQIFEMAQESDRLVDEITTFKSVAMGQEQNRTELQRTISKYENEKFVLT